MHIVLNNILNNIIEIIYQHDHLKCKTKGKKGRNDGASYNSLQNGNEPIGLYFNKQLLDSASRPFK